MGVSQVGQRLAYQNAKTLIKNAGLDPGKAVLSQSYLRLEVLCATNVTQYKFDVIANENTQTVNWITQVKLNLQDAFVVSQIGFFLCTPASAADTKFPLLTYPNVSALGVTKAPDYFSFYNGFMSLTINQRTVVPYWDLWRHYVSPPLEQNMVLATYASVAGAAVLPTNDSNNGTDDGFFPCEPNLVLVGSKKNDLTITLPAGFATITANSRIVCLLRGLLAQNSTSVN